jgi:hypothetical protein
VTEGGVGRSYKRRFGVAQERSCLGRALRRFKIGAVVLLGVVSKLFGPWQDVEVRAAEPHNAFEFIFMPGSSDVSGRFMGGTEMRVLAAHAGKLYAGNGYWEDRPGVEGFQGAQILVLDRPDGQWAVDHTFEARAPNGRPRNLAVSVLNEVTFATDGAGEKLDKSVSMMVATTWEITGTTRVFTRDDASGIWASAELASDAHVPGHLPQVRSLGAHRDRVTGVDNVFAGQDPRGIFRGVYDPSAPSRIRWNSTPELDVSAISLTAFPGLEGRLRISSFAECNGKHYAAIGQQIYERVDGTEPIWRLVYTNSRPGYSQTGLRGLTAIADSSGGSSAACRSRRHSGANCARGPPQ